MYHSSGARFDHNRPHQTTRACQRTRCVRYRGCPRPDALRLRVGGGSSTGALTTRARSGEGVGLTRARTTGNDLAPFVGRRRDLDVLADEWAVAREGSPRAVLVEGEPGIGKTALVERFLASVDVAVLRASGDESETGVALGVADQLLRHAGRRTDAGGHVEAGSLLLDVLGTLQPAVVVVDDTQWADAESLRALLFTVRRLVHDAVLVVLVVRAGETARLPDGLRKTARGVLLEPLTADDVGELAHGTGVVLSARGARRLREHSAGNPLHARALLREVPPGAWGDPYTTLPAPHSFAEVVTAQLRSLPEGARGLVEAAAVLGLRAPLGLVARVAAVDAPFDALDVPVAEHLLELGGEAEVRFVHPLIRAAVYQDLAPGRRARLHTAAAAAIGDEEGALRHRVAAEPGPDEPLAADLESYAARCGAARQWRPAVWALEAAAKLSANRASREHRVLGAIEAAMYAGDSPRARALATTTDGFAPGPALDNALAYVALGTGHGEEAERRLRRAWSALTGEEGADRVLAARVAERTAFLAVLRLRAQDAIDWAERAIALEASPGPAAGWLMLGLYWSGRRDEARALAARSEGVLVSHRATILLADDEPQAAQATVGGPAGGSLVVAARLHATRSRAALAAGSWDDAAVLAARAHAFALESDELAAQAPAYLAAVSVAALRGDFDAADRLSVPEAVFENHVADVQLGRAELAAARGAHEDVVEALAQLPHAGAAGDRRGRTASGPSPSGGGHAGARTRR
ncbi:AAA family ATPase, partial [Solirubrobacter phytolaccae]